MTTEIRGLIRDLRAPSDAYDGDSVYRLLDLVEGLLARQEEPPNDKRQWTLDNIYTIARREALREYDPRGRWGHVMRLCEAIGCQPRGVLRDNGGVLPAPQQRCPSCLQMACTCGTFKAEDPQ